ncbi:MAG: hypothetical protein AMJ64_10280, partial [Betaproteobacteria bacterium SG8_39]
MPALQIEIVYAGAAEQTIVRLVIESGATVQDAVERSGILRRLPPQATHSYGVFGRRVRLDRLLRDGDRIEI